MAPVLENWNEYDPVRQMRYGSVTHVRVIGQDDVAFFDLTVIGFHEAVDKGSKLADDHLAVLVRNHRKAIALFANTRAHCRAKQHGVHFDAYILERVLDNVDRYGIDIDICKGLGVCFNDFGWHV